MPPPTNYLGSLAVPSGGASRRGLRHGGWRANILPSIVASWINDVPDGARTTLENFWRRVLRAPLLIKPRSKSPAEAGLTWLSMQKLRVNGISSPHFVPLAGRRLLMRFVPGQPIISPPEPIK